MRSSRTFHGFLLFLLLILSGWIVYYYWNVDTLDAIRMLPKEIMYTCLGYVLVQVVKRFTHQKRYWWDWLYYIGLASAMLPTFLASSESEGFMHLLTDFGVPFLSIPVVLDIYTFFKRKA